MMKRFIDETVEVYCEKYSKNEGHLLSELRKETFETLEMPHMIAGALVGNFLAQLIKMTGAKNVVELGTFSGYSTHWMADALGKDGRIDTVDFALKHVEFARKYFQQCSYGHKITSHHMTAMEFLQKRAEEQKSDSTKGIDFAFVDADKENYPNYFKELLKQMKPGSLMVFDNCLWSGRVLAPESDEDHAIHRLNQLINEEPKVENVLLTVRDGLNVVRCL